MSALIQFHDENIGGRAVRWIELTRATKSNALSVALLDQAASAVAAVPERVIFISSRGQTFSAGLDLDEMLRLGSAANQMASLIRLYDALMRHPSPTACLVEQKAVAGGVGLALCADAVVMGCNAWFALPAQGLYRPMAEVLFPTVRSRRGIGRAEFDHWYGRKITAAELAANGHIDRVMHHDNLHSLTAELKQAAVEVLTEKCLYPASDLGDRLDRAARDEQLKLVETAVETSRTRSFRRSVQRHLGRVKKDPRTAAAKTG